MTAQQSKPANFSLLPKVINGGIAGFVGVLCVFPLDLVKTRLQNQQIGLNGEKMYKNMSDCFRKTYRAEGYFGMYRGAAVNILLITPEKAFKFAVNDYFRHHLTRPDGSLPIPHQMLAGGLVGVLLTGIATPMDLLKIQMQDAGRIETEDRLVGKKVVRPTARKIAAQIVKEKGIFGLYRGVLPTGARDVAFSVIYFPLFAFLNEMGPRRTYGSENTVFWWSFLSGLTAGSVTAFTVTPIDVVKTRLQAIKKRKCEKEFCGIIDCISKTLRYEGPMAFFKGGLCRMMVIAPLFAIAQTVYFLGVGEWIVDYKTE